MVSLATRAEKGLPPEPFFAANAPHNNPFTIFFCAALTLPPDILAQNLRI